ncbi:hypothetical protein BFJ68_g10352 [Fusarium oxysporum]|uniref:Uncharacterized protein n=1 Tax=Fusarium oxysporum TaxID=5507 RepID=A0A420QNP2_FUSOX|nr:hypothetical protein BFJ68_g10352 [Fusarium oxysporum]
MTSRNLNKTWRDTVFEQYEADYAADVPFPIRYLIYGDQWKTDILIEIPTKIDVPVFRQALLHAASSRRLENDPAYEDDLIKTALLLLATVANAWKFTIYGDGDCESTPSGDLRGDGNKDCTSIPNPHRGFWLEDMGNCQIDLYANEDDCDDGVPQQFYDATNQGVCIGPQFQWDYYTVVGC